MNEMIKIIGFIMALLLASSGFAYSAEPQVTISPKWSELNPDSKECGGFSEDRLILRIRGIGEEITEEFCSSYGTADAKIVKDVHGDNFLVLKFGLGRGTNATSDYLSVYRIEKYLLEYARIPISAPAGRSSRWNYNYTIITPKQGGLILSLSLQIEGSDSELYPKEKKRIIQIK